MPEEQKQKTTPADKSFQKAFSRALGGISRTLKSVQGLLVAKRLIKDNMGHTCVFDG